MIAHDKIRELLALVAAGALDAAEQERLERHLAECVECAQELEGWNALAGGLRRLPMPRPPTGLVERTRTLLGKQLAAEAERRWDMGVLVFLVVFAWTLVLVSWPIVRLMSEGMLGWMDSGLHQTWVWLAVYSALGWLAAAAAAVALGLRQRELRRKV